MSILPILFLTVFSGCSDGSAIRLANELTFETGGLQEITIAYDEENITFHEGEQNTLVIKEYMNKDETKYHARVTERADSIHISEGAKPVFPGNFQRYIEVCLPALYQETVNVATTSGTVDCSGIGITLQTLNARTTSGLVKLGKAKAKSVILQTTSGSLQADCITADNIKIETTSGSAGFGILKGDVDYTTTSGTLEVVSAYGAGRYKTDNSGNMRIDYAEVNGDLLLSNKNGDISLSLPTAMPFDIQAKSKNGTVTAPAGNLSAKLKVTAETGDGNIRITQ